MSIEVPCFNCQERQVGCHASCERYINFTKANQEIKERRDKENEVYKYTSEQNSKLLHKKHRKGNRRRTLFR